MVQGTGDLKAKVTNRSFKKINPDKLREYVAQHPGAYQKEIAREFGCSQSAVQKALKRLKITRYREQDCDKVAAYKSQIADVLPEKIAYVDETGKDSYLYMEYGYAPRGELLLDRISGRKYARTGIVAAQMGKEIFAPCRYDGTMNHKLFEDWFENHLLQELPKETVIVMDNASFHRKEPLYCLAENMIVT